MPSVNDRVKETTATTGLGAITLLGPVSSFQSFANAFAISSSLYYAIVGQTTTEWEVGIGTLTGGTTLSRDQILQSSNANAAVNFSAGTKDVFCTIAGFLNMNLGAWLALNSATFML
jgi:hypothetical protein